MVYGNTQPGARNSSWNSVLTGPVQRAVSAELVSSFAGSWGRQPPSGSSGFFWLDVWNHEIKGIKLPFPQLVSRISEPWTIGPKTRGGTEVSRWIAFHDSSNGLDGSEDKSVTKTSGDDTLHEILVVLIGILAIVYYNPNRTGWAFIPYIS